MVWEWLLFWTVQCWRKLHSGFICSLVCCLGTHTCRKEASKRDPEHVQHHTDAEGFRKTNQLPAGMRYLHRACVYQGVVIMFRKDPLHFLDKWLDCRQVWDEEATKVLGDKKFWRFEWLHYLLFYPACLVHKTGNATCGRAQDDIQLHTQKGLTDWFVWKLLYPVLYLDLTLN